MVWVFSRFFIFTSIFLFFILSFLTVGGVSLYHYPQAEYKEKETLLPVDVIVCLAGAKGRIEYSTHIWYEYWLRNKVHPEETVPKLFISGMGEKSNWNVFLTFVPSHIQSIITPNDVILETQSMNTEENAKFFIPLAEENSWKRALLVTSSYHIKRSLMIFMNESKSKLEIFSHALEQEPFLSGHWFYSFDGIRITFLEFLKWFFYWGLYGDV